MHATQKGPDTVARVNDKQLYDCILENVQRLYGDYGIGAVKESLKMKYANADTKYFIIRVRHGPSRFITSTLPLIVFPARLELVYCSATLKQCTRYLIKQQYILALRAIKDEENPQNKSRLKEMLKDVVKINIDF